VSARAGTRTSRRAWRRLLPALLAVLAVSGGIGAWQAFAADRPPPPTITSAPANPSSSQGATFTFSGTPSGGRLECRRDDASFATCTSPKAYSGLAAGAHSLQVRAVDNKGRTSDPASYAWTIDLTAPMVSSIARAGTSPTNAASVTWIVKFSEPVTGVAANGSNFSLVAGGLSGSPAVSGVTGSGASYTVTATTGTGTPSGSGTLQLRLTSAGAIKDAAGNALSGVPVNGPAYTIDKTPPNAPSIASGPSGLTASTNASFGFSGETGASFKCALDSTASAAACTSPKSYSGLSQGSHVFYVRQVDEAGNTGPYASRTWTVDTVPPPPPTFTQKPPNPSATASSTFAWTDSEAGVTYECRKENGAFQPCSSPLTYVVETNNSGEHQFAVRAIDAAGNRSDATAYKWKVDKGSRQNFTISGGPGGQLFPGAAASPINLQFSNPNSVGMSVTSLSVSVQSVSSAPNATPAHPCTVTNFAATQFSGSYPFTIPPGSSSLSSLGFSPVQMPKVRMLDSGGNQDGCKNATISLSYSGSAQS
jgi:large repetitive protein